MLVHAADASKAGYKDIIIRTVDTDVVIISIAMTQHLHFNELWIAFGTGSNLRYLAAHEIASRLGPEKATSLPVFHAFTGCDTVSCFSGKGKKTAWNTWMAYEQATSAFLELSYSPEDVSEECLRKLQRFVVLLYDRTSTKMQVNEARKQLFAEGKIYRGYTANASRSCPAHSTSSIPRWTLLGSSSRSKTELAIS